MHKLDLPGVISILWPSIVNLAGMKTLALLLDGRSVALPRGGRLLGSGTRLPPPSGPT